MAQKIPQAGNTKKHGKTLMEKRSQKRAKKAEKTKKTLLG
jgi:hypothetical protein